MTAVAQACYGFGLTMSEKKIETMLLQPTTASKASLLIEEAGQRYAQTRRHVASGDD